MNWLLSSLSQDLPIEPIYLLALPVLGVFLLLAAALNGGGDRRQWKRRLDRVRATSTSRRVDKDKNLDLKRSNSDSSIAALDHLIKHALPKRDQLRGRIERTGMKMSLGTYLFISLGIGIIAFVGMILTDMVPIAASALIGIASSLALPHLGTGFLAKRRQAKFIANFPEAIDLITRGLKSGLPIGESIKTAGQEVPDPVGIELRQVTDAVRLGSKLEDVLGEAAERIDLQEFRFFTISLSIQSETGGNLTETLANLSDVLRKRRQLKLKIKALSSEAKASAYIIGSLPFVMATVIYMMNPGYIMALVIDPRGHILIGLGLFSFFVGTVVMYRMVKFDH